MLTQEIKNRYILGLLKQYKLLQSHDIDVQQFAASAQAVARADKSATAEERKFLVEASQWVLSKLSPPKDAQGGNVKSDSTPSA